MRKPALRVGNRGLRTLGDAGGVRNQGGCHRGKMQRKDRWGKQMHLWTQQSWTTRGATRSHGEKGCSDAVTLTGVANVSDHVSARKEKRRQATWPARVAQTVVCRFVIP